MELFFLILLLSLLGCALATGFPVAFALPSAAIITIGLAAGAGALFAGDPSAYFFIGSPDQWLTAGVTNLRSLYWLLGRDTLIAIPLFIFMGLMLQRSKVAEDLLVTMAQLFGPVPGGLAISTVVVGALLAATTGILGATVVAMGLISLPAMLRNNYSRPMATGVIAASGTLGQIIPPSIVLIILADQLAAAADRAATYRETLYKAATGEFTMPSSFSVTPTSAGELFMGAFIPGLVLVGVYITYVLIISLLNPDSAPAVQRPAGERLDFSFLLRVLLSLLPPLVLILAVLGSIIAGVATVIQAGAVGAAGALLMAGYRLYERETSRRYWPLILALLSFGWLAAVMSLHRVNIRTIHSFEDQLALATTIAGLLALTLALVWSGIRVYRVDNSLMDVMTETTKSTSLVFIIILGAAILTAAFRAFGGEDIVREILNGMPGGFWMKFIIVMAVIFFLGFFLEFIEIAVVVIPIVAPILLADPAANVTAVWLGVIIGMNAQTSFLTPPFGFALFYMRGVAPPEVATKDIYKGVVPFIGLQLAALVIVALVPPLVNYLPQRVTLTSENAPPPRNPKLSDCLIDYVDGQYAENGDTIRSLISRTAALDASLLPMRSAKDLRQAIENSAESEALLSAYRVAQQNTLLAAGDYRPIQRDMRAIERSIRELKEEAGRVKDRRRSASDRERAAIDIKLADLTDEIIAREATIPADWPQTYAAFKAVTDAERKALLAYQRATDTGYTSVQDLVKQIEATPSLEEFVSVLMSIKADLRTSDPEALLDRISEASSRLNVIPGSDDIRNGLSAARKALKRSEPRVEKAEAELDESLKAATEELQWRTQAQTLLLPGLREYLAGLADTIGVRQQDRLTRPQAIYVARCSATHKDISLYF